jgi:Arc/MetJ-type ribon-helix-helix transcriptional regulator
MNISMPEDRYEFVLGQASSRYYGSTSEYIRRLIRKERLRVESDDKPPARIRRANEYLDGFRTPEAPETDRSLTT